LDKLTSDLGDAYDKTFEAIRCQSQSQQQLAIDALMWAAHTRRPLECLELRHALATQLSDHDLDDDNIPSLRLILKSCCGLLAVDELEDDSSEIRLVHHTLQPYIQNYKQLSSTKVHTAITQICLTYLLFASVGTTNTAETASTSAEGYEGRLKKYALVRYARDYWGYHASFSPLKAYQGLAMQLLIDHDRCEALYPDNRNTTALHIVASFGLTDLARLLLNNGCTVHTLDQNWESPLNKACSNNHTEMATLLLDHGDDPSNLNLKKASPLYTAVTHNNAELAEVLIEGGAVIDLHCKDGWTALHKAVDCGYSNLVRLLVHNGSDISETSSRGVTGLHRAAGRGYLEIMKLFIAEGVPIDIMTYDDWTPLHGAASSGKTEAVDILLTHGANIHHRSVHGKTALHRACEGGYLDTVKVLLAHGAIVTAKDANGDNPLHIAVKENYIDIVTCLLELNPEQLSQLNSQGWSPLQEAQLHGFRRIEKLFAPCN
jgi:ankyrin repeat protein